MGFLSLEKIIKKAPTERAKLEKNPEKSKETQIRVKSYDSPNSLHHSPLLERNAAPASGCC